MHFLKLRFFSTSSRRIPPIKKGKVSPPLEVPSHIDRPPYVLTKQFQQMDLKKPIEIKSPKVIDSMRRTCRIGRKVMEFAKTCVKVEISLKTKNKRNLI